VTKDPQDPYATPSDEVSVKMNITPTCVHGNIDISLGFCVSFTVTVNIHSFVVFYKNDDQPDGKILSAGLSDLVKENEVQFKTCSEHFMCLEGQ